MAMTNENTDFFASRVEVEDMHNGCMRFYYYSDRCPPGTQQMESSLILSVVVPVASCQKCNVRTRQIIASTPAPKTDGQGAIKLAR